MRALPCPTLSSLDVGPTPPITIACLTERLFLPGLQGQSGKYKSRKITRVYEIALASRVGGSRFIRFPPRRRADWITIQARDRDNVPSAVQGLSPARATRKIPSHMANELAYKCIYTKE